MFSSISDFFATEHLLAFLTLTSLEIVLGIDNIVFIAIITDKVEKRLQSAARKIGLALAMIERIFLLSFLSWAVALTEPLFQFLSLSLSGRDLILIGGGVFLIGKATIELHSLTSPSKRDENKDSHKKKLGLASALIQITILDTVFSLDSVITAVGMVDSLVIMIMAVVTAVVIMMLFANPISEFILKHPTVKVLSLAFLLLIGVFLLADGIGNHINKGYIYFAMGFSLLVEFLNLRAQKT